MPRLETAVSATMSVIFVVMTVLAMQYPADARFVPLVVAVPAALLAGWQFARDVSRSSAHDVISAKREWSDGSGAVGWLTVFLGLVVVAGFVVGGTIAVMLCQRFWLRESWRATIIGGILSAFVLFVCFERLLGLVLFAGWLAL